MNAILTASTANADGLLLAFFRPDILDKQEQTAHTGRTKVGIVR